MSYDPKRPTTEIRVVTAGGFNVDPRYQVRPEGTTDSVVKEYAQSMSRGDKFPPLVAFEVDDELILVDGWHRYKAGRRAHIYDYEVIVHIGGTLQDAFAYSRFEANRTHGLPLTRKEKEVVIRELCKEPYYSVLSSNELSKLLRCSKNTVQKIRVKYDLLPEMVRSGDGRMRPSVMNPTCQLDKLVSSGLSAAPPTAEELNLTPEDKHIMTTRESLQSIVRVLSTLKNGGYLPYVKEEQLQEIEQQLQFIRNAKNGAGV